MQPIRVTVTKIELKTATDKEGLFLRPRRELHVTLMDATADTYVSLVVPEKDAAEYALGQALDLMLIRAADWPAAVKDDYQIPTPGQNVAAR